MNEAPCRPRRGSSNSALTRALYPPEANNTSAKTGAAGEGSDLDLLVKLDEDRSLLDHVALKEDLEASVRS